MIKWIWNKIRPEKFTALGTLGNISFVEPATDTTLQMISYTFLLGDKGSRKIKIDASKHLNPYTQLTPKSHPAYFKYCVPWLNKTDCFISTDVEYLRECVWDICGYNERIKKTISSEGNVISIDFNNK